MFNPYVIVPQIRSGMIRRSILFDNGVLLMLLKKPEIKRNRGTPTIPTTSKKSFQKMELPFTECPGM
jgi:hypothetical protein